MSKQITTGVFIALLSVFFVGCSDNKYEQTKKTIAQIKSRPAKPIEALPEVKMVEPAHYETKELRSPFYRSVSAQQSRELPDLRRLKETLEAYPLDALKMVGTIIQNGAIWALISAPDGIIYPITIGNYIGKNFGRVTKITDQGVDIIESTQVGGEWRKNKAALILNEDKKVK